MILVLTSRPVHPKKQWHTSKQHRLKYEITSSNSPRHSSKLPAPITGKKYFFKREVEDRDWRTKTSKDIYRIQMHGAWSDWVGHLATLLRRVYITLLFPRTNHIKKNHAYGQLKILHTKPFDLDICIWLYDPIVLSNTRSIT